MSGIDLMPMALLSTEGVGWRNTLVATSVDQQNLAYNCSLAAVVARYVDACNRGDEDGMASCFANPAFILDGMAPHIWFGPAAATEWYRDVSSEAEHLGLSDFEMLLGPPAYDEVVGDAVYFVAPVKFNFKAQGKQINQTGATLTMALRPANEEWRIAAWTWTKGDGGGTDDVKPLYRLISAFRAIWGHYTQFRKRFGVSARYTTEITSLASPQ
jgi:ketosteroid isomerase-like protein